MRRHGKKGQSAVEYTLILGAVIFVVVLVLFGGNVNLRQRIQGAYQASSTAVQSTTGDATHGVFQP
jgi:Flp pilus assembly pilin Flp